MSANPTAGLFIDMQTPAPCSGLVMQWNICHFNPRVFNIAERLQGGGFEVGLQIWSFDGDNGELVDQYVATVDVPEMPGDFQCVTIPLPPSRYMSVVAGDVMGVAANFDAPLLPFVGNSNSLNESQLLQFRVVFEGVRNVTRTGATVLTNNVLHVTAEVTGEGLWLLCDPESKLPVLAKL